MPVHKISLLYHFIIVHRPIEMISISTPRCFQGAVQMSAKILRSLGKQWFGVATFSTLRQVYRPSLVPTANAAERLTGFVILCRCDTENNTEVRKIFETPTHCAVVVKNLPLLRDRCLPEWVTKLLAWLCVRLPC